MKMTWEQKMAWGKQVAAEWKTMTMEEYLIDERFWEASARDGVELEETDVYDMTACVMNGEW